MRFGQRCLGATLSLVLAFAPQSSFADDGAELFKALLKVGQDGDPVASVNAMYEASEVAITLPWTADGLLNAGPALELYQKTLTSLATRKKGRRARPWVAGEAAIMAARLVTASGLPSGEVAAHRAELLAHAGFLSEGLVLGPFASADVGPVPLLDREHAGRFGPIAPRPFAGGMTPDGPPLKDWLPGVGDVHAWVYYALHVSKDVDVWLVGGSNGPLAVVLDGTEVFSNASSRPHADWQHATALRLRAGRHVIAVGAGHTTEDPTFTLRLVDSQGLLPAGVTGLSSVHLDVPPPPTKDPWRLRDTPKSLPLPDLATSRADLGVFVTYKPRTTALTREAATLIRAEASPVASPCATAQACYHLARAELSADASEARILFEQSAALGHVPSLAALVDLAEARGLRADADRFARQLSRLAPRHPVALAHQALRVLELAGGAGLLPWLSGEPAARVNPRLATMLATAEAANRRVPHEGAAWGQVARLRGAASDPLQRSVNAFLRAGLREDARATVAEAMDLRPQALDPLLLWARVETGVLPAAQIAEKLEHFSSFHAHNPLLFSLLGRLHLLAENKTAAVAAFDRALELSPQDRDLADYRRDLVDERGLAEGYFVSAAAIHERAALTPKAPEGASYLLDIQRIRVFDSGLSSAFRQYAIRIDDDRVAERYQDQTFPFTPGEDRVELLEAEVLRADGTRLRPARVVERRSPGKEGGVYTLAAYRVVTFPPLKPGDIIHIQSRRDEIGTRNLFGDFFGHFAALSAPIPKHGVDFAIDAPEGRPLYIGQRRVEAAATKETSNGRSVIRWEIGGLPAVIVEPDMPGYGDVGAWLNVSTFASWAEMTTWYRALIAPQLVMPDALRTLALGLVAADATVADKVRAVHAWVVRNTRYVGIEFGIHGFKPYQVGEIVRRGYGDCKDKASLIVAMLREVGVPAEFVLVRTRDMGRLGDAPATLWAFNHAIAYVPGMNLYIDGTAEQSGLGELPDLDQGAQMLRFDPYGQGAPVFGEIPMQTAEENRVHSETNWAVDASGAATATLTETAHGSNAARLRYTLADPTRRKDQLSQILASQWPGTEVSDVSFSGLDGLGEPVTIEVQLRLPNVARLSGESLVIPVNISPGRRIQEWGRTRDRKQPLQLRVLERETSLDRWATPGGFEVETLPEPVTLDTPFGAWTQQVAVSGDQVVVATSFEPRAWRISADDYPAWRAFLEAIARAEGATMRFRPVRTAP